MLQIPSFVIAAFVLPLCLSFYFALLSLSCLPLALFPLSSILLSHLMLYLLVGRFWKTASMVVVSYYDFGGGGWQRVPSVVSSGIVWLLWLLWLRMVVTGRWWERYPFSLNYSLTHSLSTPGCPCLAGYSFGLNFVLKGKKNDGCANTLNLKSYWELALVMGGYLIFFGFGSCMGIRILGHRRGHRQGHSTDT